MTNNVADSIFTEHAHVIRWPTFEFDGRRFDLGIADSAAGVSLLYLAKKARGGDADAAEVLRACSVTVLDADGRAYWPSE